MRFDDLHIKPRLGVFNYGPHSFGLTWDENFLTLKRAADLSRQVAAAIDDFAERAALKLDPVKAIGDVIQKQRKKAENELADSIKEVTAMLAGNPIREQANLLELEAEAGEAGQAIYAKFLADGFLLKWDLTAGALAESLGRIAELEELLKQPDTADRAALEMELAQLKAGPMVAITAENIARMPVGLPQEIFRFCREQSEPKKPEATAAAG